MKQLLLTKKFILKLSISITLLIALILLLNIKVTTLQGIDYQIHTIRVPLYLKILDFIDRHYNYKQLVQRITEGEKDEQKRVMKIFSWTYHNIRKQPEDLPVIDDHVWHIIVRRYGVPDQSCDVFATLCNYAGVDAFYESVSANDKEERIAFSFVRLDNQWHAFDPYNGIYFVDTSGKLANINGLKKGDFRLEHLGPTKKDVSDYKICFINLPDVKEVGLRRQNIQSPFKRLLFELKK